MVHQAAPDSSFPKAGQGVSREQTAAAAEAPARQTASPSNYQRLPARCQRTGWLAQTNRPAALMARWPAHLALASRGRWLEWSEETRHPPSVSLSANPPRLAAASAHRTHKTSGRAGVARYRTRMIAYSPFLAWLRCISMREQPTSAALL